MLTTLILVLTTTGVLMVALRSRDPGLLAIGLSITIFYVLRAVILAFNLEPPEPAYLFPGSTARLYATVNGLLLLWMASILALAPMRRRPPRTQKVCRARVNHLSGWSTVAIATLVLMSDVYLLQRHGSFAGVQRYARLGDEGSGGTGVFLLAPSILLVVSLVGYREAPRRGSSSAIHAAGIALACASFFLVGSRTPILAVLGALVIGVLMRSLANRSLTARHLFGAATALTAAPVIAVMLARLRGNSIVISSTSEMSQAPVSKALNGIFYDAFALVVRDANSTYSALDLNSLWQSLLSIVPRALWPGKPELLSVGKWLRTQYEPWRINGWPVGAPGDWYLMLGVIGLPVGALVTVFILRQLSGLAELVSPTASAELTALWCFMVMKAGVDIEFGSRFVVWVVVPIAYLTLMRRKTPPSQSDERHDYEPVISQ